MGMFSNLLNIKLFLQSHPRKSEIIQRSRFKIPSKKYDEIFEEMKAVPSGIQEMELCMLVCPDSTGEYSTCSRTLPNVPLTIA